MIVFSDKLVVRGLGPSLFHEALSYESWEYSRERKAEY